MVAIKNILLFPFRFYLRLYKHGFRNMTRHGRTLWIIAILKLVLMFGLLKVFFFQKHLDQFETEEQKIEHVHDQLTNIGH